VAIHRVLQILQDTDATDQHVAALELHSGLTHAGVEVRTLALGPGAMGQLAMSVPVISPSRHSIAAYTQLRAEQRWADALILQGSHAAEVAVLVSGSLPTAISLWSDPADWQLGQRLSLRMARSIRSGAQLVVHTAAAQASTQHVLDLHNLAPKNVNRPSNLHLIHTGVSDTGQNAAGLQTAAQITAKRRAAKQALGQDESAVTIRQIGAQAVPKRRARPGLSVDVQFVASELGANFIDARAGATFDEELLLAATDVVVSTSGIDGPSVELLQAMQAGAVAVTEQAEAMSELIIDHETGLDYPADKSAQDSLAAALREVHQNMKLRTQLASAGTERVKAEYALGQVQACWLNTLSAALASLQ